MSTLRATLTGVNTPQSSGVTFGNVLTLPTRGRVASIPGLISAVLTSLVTWAERRDDGGKHLTLSSAVKSQNGPALRGILEFCPCGDQLDVLLCLLRPLSIRVSSSSSSDRLSPFSSSRCHKHLFHPHPPPHFSTSHLSPLIPGAYFPRSVPCCLPDDGVSRC